MRNYLLIFVVMSFLLGSACQKKSDEMKVEGMGDTSGMKVLSTPPNTNNLANIPAIPQTLPNSVAQSLPGSMPATMPSISSTQAASQPSSMPSTMPMSAPTTW